MKKELLFTQFDSIFFERTRLSMLTLLYKEETVSFNRIKKILDLSDGAAFTHLKKLIASKYIDKKKEIVNNKAESSYTLTKEGRLLFKKYLKFLEELM